MVLEVVVKGWQQWLWWDGGGICELTVEIVVVVSAIFILSENLKYLVPLFSEILFLFPIIWKQILLS